MIIHFLNNILCAAISKEHQLSQNLISSCTCLGQELTFECTVDGDGATYWQESALQECPNQNRVIIRHSQHHILFRNDCMD